MQLLQIYEKIASLDWRSVEEDVFLDFVWDLALLDDALFEQLQRIEIKLATDRGCLNPDKIQSYRNQIAKFMEYGGLDCDALLSPSSDLIACLEKLRIVDNLQMGDPKAGNLEPRN